MTTTQVAAKKSQHTDEDVTFPELRDRYKRSRGRKDAEIDDYYDYGVVTGHRDAKLKRDTTIELTVDKAAELLEAPQFDQERKLSNPWVDTLARIMERGRFRAEWVLIIVCIFKGVRYRLNGQHTCWARIDTEGEEDYEVRYLEYEVKSEAAMRDLYTRIDRNKARSFDVVMRAYLEGTDQYDKVSPDVLRLLPKAYKFWKWENRWERSKRDPDEIATALLHEDDETVKRVCRMYAGFNKRDHGHMFRAPVMAAAMACCAVRGAVGDANDFFKRVADGLELRSADQPEARLRNLLIKRVLNAGKQSVKPEQMYRWVIRCWNAYREGRELQQVSGSYTGDRPEAV